MKELFSGESVACFWYRILCKGCGRLRMAVASELEIPEGGKYPCPNCQGQGEFEKIGAGETARPLPLITPEFDMDAAYRDIKWLMNGGKAAVVAPQRKVLYFPEPNIVHIGIVLEIWTSAAHISATGQPSLSLKIGDVKTDAIPHVSKAKGTPCWMRTSELQQFVKSRREQPANGSNKKAAASGR